MERTEGSMARKKGTKQSKKTHTKQNKTRKSKRQIKNKTDK